MEQITCVTVMPWPSEEEPPVLSYLAQALLKLAPVGKQPEAVRVGISNYEPSLPHVHLTRDMPESIFKQIEESEDIEDVSCVFVLEQGNSSSIAEIPRKYLPIGEDGMIPNDIFCTASEVKS